MNEAPNIRLDCRDGKGLEIADELESVYYPLMRAALNANGGYEDGRDAGLRGVYKHLTGAEPQDMEALITVYTEAYDKFAGPTQFRHSVNMDHYHRAGLLGVYLAEASGN